MTSSAEPNDPLDIVAVGIHPDDLEIICGGTLALLAKQGYRVGLVDLTTGEPTPRGTEEQRRQEAEAARHTLGVQLRLNLNLPNRELFDNPAARYALGTVLRRHQPRVLILCAGRTPAASPDHHQGHMIGEAARFYSQLTKWDDRFAHTPPHRVPHLVYAPFPFEAEQRLWHGTFVIDIAETFEQKLAAVRCYQSQFDDERFAKVRHFLTGHNIYHGSRCGFAYGELFALPHPVGARDLFTLALGGQGSPAPVQLPGKTHLPMA
ncbi:MAG: PIG-L family deacetylase [Gemmataceae bacterium]